MIITSREELKEFALRQNGHPVIEVSVTDEQVEDAVDLAMQYVDVRSPVEWNDYRLKMATAAFVLKQFGINLMKFEGIQLVGGAQLNGAKLYEVAICALQALRPC